MRTALIESMNVWGASFVHYIGPLLWQSSLLILLLFAFDFAFRKRLRPGVRYLFWMLLFVKLALPPSLAFPTSPAWWLPLNKQMPVNQPVQTTVVSVRDLATTVTQTTSNSVSRVARPRLSSSGLIFLSSASVSLALTVLALISCRQPERGLRKSKDRFSARTEPPALLSAANLLATTAKQIGFKRPVRLVVTDKRISPAVYGLLRPVVVIPRSLLDELSPAQQRIVFLHEILHLQRGDIWINCLQTVFQVIFWWHPLLWLANERIRTLREQAVDDAVMHALGTASDDYPMTLLGVARLTLQRTPLLGLIGILETKRALSRRIERLAQSSVGRKASLSFATVLAVLAFGVVAVPMGPAPREILEERGSETRTIATPAQTEEMLIAASPHYASREGAFPFSDLPLEKPATDKVPVLGDLPLMGRLFRSESSTSFSGALAEIQRRPAETNQALVTRIIKIDPNTFFAAVRREVWLPENASGTEVFKAFRVLLEKANIHLDPPKSLFLTERVGRLHVYATLEDISSIERLIGTLNTSETEDKVPVLGDFPLVGRLFRNESSASISNPVVYRDPWNQPYIITLDSTQTQSAAPEGAAERKLGQQQPQITVQAKFVELSHKEADRLKREFANWNTPHPTEQPNETNWNYLLSEAQFRSALRSIKAKKENKLLSDSVVTTVSGRQCQIQVVQEQQFLKVHGPAGNPPKEPPTFETQSVRLGDTLDVTPALVEGGKSVDLAVYAYNLEFLGYDQPRSDQMIESVTGGKRSKVNPPLPHFRIHNSAESTKTFRIPNGQTLALGNFQTLGIVYDEHGNSSTNRETVKKELVIFLSPEVIDATGKPVHSPDDGLPGKR